jgi:hypothetical protein
LTKTIKFEIEIPYEDVVFIEKELKLDPRLLLQNLVNQALKAFKELTLADEAGVSITPQDALRAGMELGKDIFENSQKREEG